MIRQSITAILSILYTGTGFLGLLPGRMKTRYYLFYAMHLSLIYTVLTPLGQFLTFPLILISLLIVYLGYDGNLLCVLLSMTGYLIGITLNHLLTIPLTLLGFSIEQLHGRCAIPFLLTAWLATAIALFLSRRLLNVREINNREWFPRKLQAVFILQLLLCTGLIGVNFIYGDYVGYPPQVLTFNGLLVSLFALFTLLLFHFLYKILQENYELRYGQKEQEILRDYTDRMESFYEDFRVFRHDYKNILSTLQYYIEKNDMEELQTYFQEKILPSGEALTSDNYIIGKLYLVELPAVKSILYSKLVMALNRGISPSLELTEPLRELAMDDLVFSRIIGILLDNAIEAATDTEERLLSIALIRTQDGLLFSCANSSPPPKVPIASLYAKGYTTKEKHDGLGLYTVQQLTDAMDHVSYVASYDGMFRQTLEIRDLTPQKTGGKEDNDTDLFM